MTALKGLALAATLIVGTTSLAMAQAQGFGPDGQAFDGAADKPSTPQAARRHDTKHHFPRMFMSAHNKKGTPKTGLPNGGY
jgi:hypothetical protein